MKTPSMLHRRVLLRALALALSITGVCTAQTQNSPSDLTQAGAIDAIKAREDVPTYNHTYNLGATGLRGWVHQNWSLTSVGQITEPSRQILVTTASTPGSAVIAVDDVILGAMAASSGTVPLFTSDARKAFGTALTNAEKTGAGTLRVKRWRAGTTSDVNIPITTLGTYTATAPYNCPKSSAILASTRDQMVGKLLADANYLNSGHGHAGAINALALLASVEPSHPNYAAVQTRLQTYARSLGVPTDPGMNWDAPYQLIFLSEYYLLTRDSQVVPVINGITIWYAKGQGMFGTFGHGLGIPYPDGSGRNYIPWYGPVNAIGNIANIAIVLGKKALQAAIANNHFSQGIDPSIDVAIQRSTGFMGSHINKGTMQYGEHFPHAGSHATNSKDATAAVFFGLQSDKPTQTEYFARMAISSWIGVELGHGGQGWGTLWGALASGMGGEAAASAHFKQLLWRYDIHRRTDGSFTFDSDTGGNDYYGGKTADGTYLGESWDSSVRGSSLFLLTYSLPLKRLYITGKDLNTAYNHDLDAAKIANAVSAATYALDRTGKSIAQLFTDLGEYDPTVRHFAAVELASRHKQSSVLTSADLTTLRNLLNDPNANLRQSAAQTLGYIQDSAALPTLVALLRDPHHWVRQKAAHAIRHYANTAAVSVHRNAMLEAFIANAPADPDTIDWSDPLQFSNGELLLVLFGGGSLENVIYPRYSIEASTANAPKETHLYPALRIALLHPSGATRISASRFVRNRLSSADAQALFPELVEVQSCSSPGDSMFGSVPRGDAMTFLAAAKIKEGIPLALTMIGNSSGEPLLEALNALASYGDAARYTLPTLRQIRDSWASSWWYSTPDGAPYLVQINATITTIENAITAPATIPGLCVANSQTIATTGAKAITLTGSSTQGAFSFLDVTAPANGTLTGTAPNLTYTPNGGFSGTDKFTFRTKDSLTTSDPATVSIIVGTPGNGIAGAYFNNADFTGQVLTRTDPQINFDWGTGSPDASIGADSFSTRWSGYLLAPETGTYSLSSLTSDGVRAYLNGVPVINNFNDQSTRWTDGQSISLTAGQKVPLLLEYYENTGSAVAKLKWTGPSFAGLNGDIIPQAYLFENNSSGGADTTAPVISALFPAVNATQAARDTVLVATFSENIVPGTGNITIKNLSDGSQTVISVTDSAHVTISGATMVITPPTLLVSGNSYAIQIASTAIRDASGNNFAGITNDTTWNFTTVAGRITWGPISVFDDATDVNANGLPVIVAAGANWAGTVNGVTFTDQQPGTLSSFNSSGAFGVGTFLNATGNAAFDALVGTQSWNDPSVTSNTISLSGLTVGWAYRIQAIFADDRDTFGVYTLSGTLGDLDGGTASGSISRGNTGLKTSGNTIYGDFTADADGIQQFTVNGNLQMLTGYVLTTTGADTAPPVISTLNPADNATGVALGANLVATFSESIAKGTGNITVKNLTDGTQSNIAVTDTTQVTISGTTLTITPTVDLDRGKSYAIRIAATAIRDVAGNSFAGITDDMTWRFTASSTVGKITWGAVSVFDDATDVNANGLAVTVAAGANWAGTVNGVTFTDQQPGTLSSFNSSGAFGAGTFLNATGNTQFDALVGTQSWNDPEVTSTTISLSDLTVGQAYRIQVIFADDRGSTYTLSGTLGDLDGGTPSVTISRGNTGLKTSGNTIYGDFTADADGIQEFTVNGNLQMLTGYVLTTTGADTAPPTISTYSPGGNSTGVAIGANLVATFSENVTIGTGNIMVKNLTDATSTTIAVTDTTQVSISGAVLTINPTANLAASKNYAVQIAATAIKDLANNNYAGINNDTTWNFATGISPPGGVTGLALWLDASDPGTMTLSGSTVTEWRNRAGSTAKMTLSGGNPTAVASGIGGLPTVHFTSASQSEMRDGVNHPAPVTVFYVSRQTGGTNKRVLDAHNNNWLLGYWEGKKGSAWFGGNVFLNGNGNSDTAPHLYAATIPGGSQNSTVWAEGIQVASNTGGTLGPNNLKLGGGLAGGNGGEWSDCDISEVLVYHRVLTSVELDTIGAYLSSKYGLATSYGPPVISSLSPADNATGVAVGANLVATFSENITIGTGNITIRKLTPPASDMVIPVSDPQVSVSGKALTINPTSDLLPSNNYAVLIATTAIDDLAGNSYAGITTDTGWNFTTAPDTAAPTPNPMSFATPPAALGQTSITMTATTATDPSGVEYFFECTAGGGHSSAWQDSPTYTDTGLTAATQYFYRVRARDKSAAQTATAWSAAASATTDNTPFSTWAADPAQGLTVGVNAGPNDDPDNDDIHNLMEFVLGGAPMVSNQSILPKLIKSTGEVWTFEYDRSVASRPPGTTQVVEYGDDLTGWADIPIPATSAGAVTITPGTPTDHVSVVIPGSGGKAFARLKVANAP